MCETLAELEVSGDAAFDPAGLVWLPRASSHPPDSSKNVEGVGAALVGRCRRARSGRRVDALCRNWLARNRAR